MKQYRFKFVTKRGVLLGYFLSIGSKLVSQQEAKIFTISEQALDIESNYIYNKYMWVFDDIEVFDGLKQIIKSQFGGLKKEDILLKIEKV